MSKDKKPLQPGDRVRVVHGTRSFTGKVSSFAMTYADREGVFHHVIEDGFYSAHEDGPFHRRQCVRLVKRKAREWEGRMAYGYFSAGRVLAFVPDKHPEGLFAGTRVTLREVREKGPKA